LAILRTEDYYIEFTSREVSAWGGHVLLKKMIDRMCLFRAIQSLGLPMPASNWGYDPAKLIEQISVSIWCGANLFVHLGITLLDKTFARLFG